ncbi:MAG: GatB/YqeY domain-containing protein [Chloroflexia bacterium]|nr:GatB/YqeY domain-containing protein [Chloroflexia bacterium]
MSLREQILKDTKAAMLQQDKERVGVLRMVKAAIREKEIDLQHELDDQEVLAVLTKAAKQRQESIESYREAGRDDLLQTEERELLIIEGYLPRQLGPEEVQAAVAQAIDELEAQGPQDMGRVMKHLMAQLRGQVDGRLVNEMVREALST